MDCNLYLKNLSRNLYWRCSKNDADDILADYEEMLFQFPDEQYNTIVEKFGTPMQVAKMMSQPKTYYVWLGVFMLMAFSLFIPEILLLQGGFNKVRISLLYLIFVIGSVTSLIWFRPNRGIKAEGSHPRMLLAMLLILLVVTVISCAFLMGLFTQMWTSIPFNQYGLTARLSLLLTGTVATIMGGYGLIQARLADYRWRTLYVIGLTVLIACISLLTRLTSIFL